MYDNDNIRTSLGWAGWGNFRNKLKRMSVQCTHTHKYDMRHQPHNFKYICWKFTRNLMKAIIQVLVKVDKNSFVGISISHKPSKRKTIIT